MGRGAAGLAGERRNLRSRPRRRPAAKAETVQPCKKQVQGQRGRGLFPRRSPHAGTLLASREIDSDPIFLRLVGAGLALMVKRIGGRGIKARLKETSSTALVGPCTCPSRGLCKYLGILHFCSDPILEVGNDVRSVVGGAFRMHGMVLMTDRNRRAAAGVQSFG